MTTPIQTIDDITTVCAQLKSSVTLLTEAFGEHNKGRRVTDDTIIWQLDLIHQQVEKIETIISE